MSYKKLATLTKRLYERTLAGSIDWEETALNDVYQTSLADYSLRISLEESQTLEVSQSSVQSDVKIAIVNDVGSVIESFLDEDLSPEWFHEIGVNEHPYKIMYSIYEIARRRALGSEQAINDILKELDDEDIPF